MKLVSVNNIEKRFSGANFDYETIKSLNHKWVEFPMSHILFEYIKKTVKDYIYYVDGGGCTWRKIKYKDEFYYYDEDCQDWVFDDEMDASYMKYTAENEAMCRFIE